MRPVIAATGPCAHASRPDDVAAADGVEATNLTSETPRASISRRFVSKYSGTRIDDEQAVLKDSPPAPPPVSAGRPS